MMYVFLWEFEMSEYVSIKWLCTCSWWQSCNVYGPSLYTTFLSVWEKERWIKRDPSTLYSLEGLNVRKRLSNSDTLENHYESCVMCLLSNRWAQCLWEVDEARKTEGIGINDVHDSEHRGHDASHQRQPHNLPHHQLLPRRHTPSGTRKKESLKWGRKKTLRRQRIQGPNYSTKEKERKDVWLNRGEGVASVRRGARTLKILPTVKKRRSSDYCT